jgi:hypothetical protein
MYSCFHAPRGPTKYITEPFPINLMLVICPRHDAYTQVPMQLLLNNLELNLLACPVRPHKFVGREIRGHHFL